ncbi:MAG: alanine/ornithine racemase family PLP-dependent enzyme [Chitinivibrionales bacterium]|nr:alanine/ornithine racemase family PLP-dependent enzyme [Chitinivibrionales bacterium]
MSGPVITIDCTKIEHNSRSIVSLCKKFDIQVSAITKVTCGCPQVAFAMLAGGVSGIGESRIDNIIRLRSSGVASSMLLLRIPSLSDAAEVVAMADMSLNSELSVINALSDEAVKRGTIHRIILMVDLGDLREGIMPGDLLPTAEAAARLPGVKIIGLGTNLTCYGGVIPSTENLGRLVAHAAAVEKSIGYKLTILSGGNSSSIPLLLDGTLPSPINHLRIGEAIVLGRDTVFRQPIPETYQDAFVLCAEIIELKEKPTLPQGELCEDAFGNKPVFIDRGNRLRAILAIGRQDVAIEGLSPLSPGAFILGASSDHLIVDVTDVARKLSVGMRLSFSLNYAALLAAMTSPYVTKKFVPDSMECRKQ